MFKGISTLTLGQVVNQLITLIGYIYLARLYDVADFGELALILAVGSIIGGVSTLQYELTVLLPKAQSLVQLAAISTILTAFFINCFYAVVLCLAVLADFLSAVDACAVLFVSFATAVVGLASSTLNRSEQYLALVCVNIFRTLVALLLAITLAVVSENGLVLAHSAASILIVLVLITFVVCRKQLFYVLSNPKRYLYWLKRHREFAIHTTPAAMFNYLAGSAPIFLLSSFFGVKEVGLFSMLQRVVMGPVGIVASAVNRVFQRELTKRLYNKSKIFVFFESLSKKLVFLGFLGGAILALIAYFKGMGYVFGSKWEELDGLAMLFVPVCIVSFFSSSLAGFAVIGENKLGMAFQFSRLVAVCIAFLLGFYLFNDFNLVVFCISVALTIMFIAQWLAMAQVSASKDAAARLDLGAKRSG